MNRPSLTPRPTEAPALALLELRSVARGFDCADQVAKAAPVELLLCEAVTPGKFLVMFSGQVAAVISSLAQGRTTAGVDLESSMLLAHAHPSLLEAVRGQRKAQGAESVGVLEMDPIAPLLEAADRMAKSASVELLRICVAMRLGGRAYCVLAGALPQVQTAIARGLAVPGTKWSRSVVLSRPHADLDPFLR